MRRQLILLGLIAIGAFLCAYGRIDRSGIGLSEVWRIAHGGHLIPDEDSDRDGFSNSAESIAGTNPHDANSYPKGKAFFRDRDNRLITRFQSESGVRYQLEASPDFDAWYAIGEPVIGDGQEREFSFALSNLFVAGGLYHAAWTGLSSSGLAVIKNYVSNQTPPHVVGSITTLDIPQSNPNRDQFGQYIRGWLVPPTTGWYSFWIAGDDGCELWLSTNNSPLGKSRIAFVSGWTSYQQWTKYPEQLSAPIRLEANRAYYVEIYHREGGGGDHLTVAWTRPDREPNSREIIGAPHISPIGLSMDSMATNGSLLFRLRVNEADSDGDGITDYEEALLGLNPLMTNSKPRQPDWSAALQILDSGNLITVGATEPRAYESAGASGRFTFYRAGGIHPLNVQYEVTGTATAGVDYQALSGTLQIPAGQRSVSLDLIPLADGLVEPRESVTITLQPGAGFELGVPASATVHIDDERDVLYVAALRPLAEVPSSGYGYAVIRRAGNGLGATVRLQYHGLAGSNVVSALLISSNGLNGTSVLDLPPGQITELAWDLAPTNGMTHPALVAAMDAEQLWIRLRSSAYPGGELAGRFVRSPGWQTMPTPPPAPPAPTVAASDGEAARFLTQATFGPQFSEITNLTGKTYASWIDTQMDLPPTYHLPYVEARRAELLARDGNDGWQSTRQEAWWQHALTAPDQLRQRMAWALSQILVISQFGALDGDHVGSTVYYDMLLRHAFGNYRDLLEEVTLSPMMGTYLSMMRNRKPNPETGHEPDENYAREVMQLFSVGLMRMHPDGSLMLDAEGMPIPTYTQEDIVGLAHVFTGWSAHYDYAHPPEWSEGNVADPDDWFIWGWDPLRPMSFYGSFHDTSNRVIIGNTLIPAGTNGLARLRLALDTLFQHPNVGPFIARQLIQRFVTSNPSPGYIFRVASVFNDNGAGVRGDLGATLKAVLLDHEARSTSVRGTISYGKPIEPVMRLSRMLRMFLPPAPFATNGDHRLFLNFQYSMPEQAPLLSPSVFNFFQPVFSQPGRITQEGLVSPEFQIFAETTAIREANLHYSILNWGIWTPEPITTNENAVLQVDLSRLVSILQTPGLTPAVAQSRLIDHLDQTILFGSMSAHLRTTLHNAFNALPSWFDYSESRQRQRAVMALYLIYNSPEFLTQR